MLFDAVVLTVTGEVVFRIRSLCAEDLVAARACALDLATRQADSPHRGRMLVVGAWESDLSEAVWQEPVGGLGG